MLARLLKRLARTIPYARRAQDGVAEMRAHVAALERHLGQLQASERDARDRALRLEARLDAQSRRIRAYSDELRGIAAPPADQAGIVTFVDNAWCDSAGVFVNGWVHAGSRPVHRVSLACGEASAATTDLSPRPDVSQFYPDLPPGGAAGFTLYLACPGQRPLTLAVQTDDGIHEAELTLPYRPDEDGPDSNGAMEAFVAAMRDRAGTVLELGARDVGEMTRGWRSRFEPPCRYLANDIHPAPGIDAVGDVHALTGFVAPGSLDGVFSVAVLEHLAAPWLAAAEINRALRPGGETLHVTHQTWPVHEMPNDFFRMSDQALRSLFGPATGFEVIECRMAYPVAVVPPPAMRHDAWLWTPVGRGYAQSFIRARKVAELDAATASWGTGDLRHVSEAYPNASPG